MSSVMKHMTQVTLIFVSASKDQECGILHKSNFSCLVSEFEQCLHLLIAWAHFSLSRERKVCNDYDQGSWCPRCRCVLTVIRNGHMSKHCALYIAVSNMLCVSLASMSWEFIQRKFCFSFSVELPKTSLCLLESVCRKLVAILQTLWPEFNINHEGETDREMQNSFPWQPCLIL